MYNFLGKDAEKKNIHLHFEEVRESEAVFADSEIYRLIADHASDMISILDADSYCFSYVSPSYKKVLAYDAQDLLGHSCLDLVHPDDRANALQGLLQGIEAGYGRAEYRVLLRDGSELWLESIGKRLDEQDRTRGILLISRDINERKQAEEALKHSEAKYRLIMDNAYDMIERISADDFRYLYVNNTILQVLGFSKEEMLGSNSLELIHPEDRKRLMERLGEGIMAMDEEIAEYRYQKKDGSYMWVEASGKIFKTDNGDLELLFINRDISKRKIAEEALRKSEHQLRRITDNMLDSICSLHEDGTFEYVSPSHQSLMGFDPVELMGRNNLHLVHPDDRNRVMQYFASHAELESTGKIEYRAQHKAGHYIWMESFGRMVIDEYNGEKQFVAGTRDITARKQVEEELRQSKQHLQEQLRYLNTLISTMNELCYTIDRDHRLTFVNQKAVDITGYNYAEVRGRSIFDFIPEYDQEKVSHQLRTSLEVGYKGSSEHSILCKDGRELLVRVKSSPIIENDKITGVLVLAEDISQQRRIEKEMARLGQMNTVGEMAASIGHEIRNPMTTVQGFLQIMSQNEQLSEQRPYFDLMLDELARANSIITEFLSLAKDKLLNLQCHNLNKIIEVLAPLLVADAIKGDKCIRFMLENIPDLLLDEKEIRQLILNLVRNGLEAMSPGGTILIKTWLEADGAVLAVQDEGAGIAPEIREQIGTPFFSSKENGIGLGLAVCYSIVARHNARMDYETGSTGTTFRVKFVAGNSGDDK